MSQLLGTHGMSQLLGTDGMSQALGTVRTGILEGLASGTCRAQLF